MGGDRARGLSGAGGDHALGIDVGLSGARAAVVRSDGALVGAGRRPHRRAVLADGRAEHDPRDWLEGVEAAAAAALAQAPAARVAVVGVAALGPAPVLVDAALAPLTPAPLFALDRRAEPQRRALTAHLPAREAAQTLDSAVPKLAWWQEHEPGLVARAAYALDATGFLVAALTGTAVMDRVTAADYALPGVAAPVPSPAPVEPTAIAGPLHTGGAQLLGLPAGVPVIAGTYDSFADIAAAGVRRPGDAGVVLGSTVIVVQAAERAAPRDGLGVAGYPGEGVLLGGWTLAGGLVLDWLDRVVGDADASLEAPGAGGLLALPHLAGERTPLWDPGLRGAITGLALDTTRAQIQRAFIDALALVARDHGERLAAALGRAPRWRATGGGVHHEAWAQATADALGAPLDLVAHAGEAVAPALLALEAIGCAPERPVARVLAPDAGRHAAYAALHERYRRLQEAAAVIPPTMRAARLHGVQDLRVETLPVPQPGPGEVLVRVEACGVCPTDARKFALGAADYPLNPGHEWVGEVVALGEGVRGPGIGERVYGDTYAGYAEYAAIQAQLGGWSRGALALPGLPAERAIFVEPLADCLHAVLDQGAVRPGDRVVVLGAGAMGIQLVAVAARAGARVTAVEPRADRRELALRFGAHAASEPDGWPLADVVIVSVASAELAVAAVERCAPGGRVVLFAGFAADGRATVDLNRLHYEEIALVGSEWVGAPPRQRWERYDDAAALLGELELDALISHRVGLDGVETALREVRAQRSLKTVLLP